MIDVFSFPDEYKSQVSMGKENFIESGNLTPTEKAKLSSCLQNVEVLYDLQCRDDSEIIVLGIEFDYNPTAVQSNYLMEIIGIVATALPYRCVILANRKEKARIYTFDGRINSRNNSRMHIQKCHATPTFNPSRIPPNICSLIEHFTEVFQEYECAEEVVKWFNWYMSYDTNGVDIVRGRENF